MPDELAPSKSITTWQIFLLGLGRVLLGHYALWNENMQMGFFYFLGTLLFSLSIYWCAALCIAELSSALPFTGGLYGYVRGILGPSIGFMCGICELLFNLIFIAGLHLLIGSTIGGVLGETSKLLNVCIGLVVMIIVTIICGFGGKWFWNISSTLVIVALLLLLVYIFASIPNIDVNHYLVNFDGAEDKTFNYMSAHIIRGSYFMIGIETIPILAHEAIEPTISIPRALLYCMGVITFTSIAVTFVVCAQYPGASDNLASVFFPLSFGYKNAFHISRLATVLLFLPGLIACGLSTLYITSRIVMSMAESALLPSIFSKFVFGPNKTPYIAIVCILVISIPYGLIFELLPSKLSFETLALEMILEVLLICWAYVVFRWRYEVIPRNFRSPLGIYGGIYGVIASVVVLVAYFHKQNWYSIIINIGFLVIVYVFYLCYVQFHQKFNEEESNVLFQAYVINHNRNRTLKVLHNSKTHTKNLNVNSPKTSFHGLFKFKLSLQNHEIALQHDTHTTTNNNSIDLENQLSEHNKVKFNNATSNKVYPNIDDSVRDFHDNSKDNENHLQQHNNFYDFKTNNDISSNKTTQQTNFNAISMKRQNLYFSTFEISKSNSLTKTDEMMDSNDSTADNSLQNNVNNNQFKRKLSNFKTIQEHS